MKIVAAGVSGFLGTRLTDALVGAGHQVTRLVRSGPTGPGESLWNPHAGNLDSAVFDGADAVINLCGAGVGDHRWTANYKHLLMSSRLNPTRLLAAECARLGVPTLVNASGVDYYADRGSIIVTENGPASTRFSAELCQQWEAATSVASDGRRTGGQPAKRTRARPRRPSAAEAVAAHQVIPRWTARLGQAVLAVDLGDR